MTNNVGTHMHDETRGVRLNKVASKVAYRHCPSERVSAKESPNRNPGFIHSDEQVAHLRWLYEKDGWSPTKLMSAFNLDKAYIYRICQGLTRSRLTPKRSDNPNVMSDFSWRDKPAEPESVSVEIRVALPIIKKKAKRDVHAKLRARIDRQVRMQVARRDYYAQLRNTSTGDQA